MSDYDSCEMSRSYTLGTRTCPYCREYELDITARITYKSRHKTTEIWVSSDKDWHIERCRDNKLLKNANFIDNAKVRICGTCEHFTPTYYYSDGDRDYAVCDLFKKASPDYTGYGVCDLWEEEEE